MAKPFIKWVGGKTQLLDEINARKPKKFSKYCEPFVGGGAVLFNIIEENKPDKILINDINPDLANLYFVVKNAVAPLICLLKEYDKEYKASDDRQAYYLAKRTRYNNISITFGKIDTENIEDAALFIFLNKTCFNGLYRVNSNGHFNVPHGDYKNPKILDEENLEAASKALTNVTITNDSYKSCLSFIDADTFVYFDPPYRPLSTSSSFTAYSKSGFCDKEQKELKLFVDKVVSTGAKFELSNSDPKNTDPNDNFFDTLYNTYTIDRVKARRNVNSKGSARNQITEILVYI